MFLGEHQHTLDAKGRVILPAKFRERLKGGLVFVPAQDRCIDVYPRAVFEKRVEEWRDLPREDQRARAFLRTVLAQAHEEVPDGQGRVTIPQRLRDYAGLDKELAINGADFKLEIWDRARWEDYRSNVEEDFANLDGVLSL
ncbi:MAG: division/cell wall cluster transcriptional repressor MraZ [Nitriliruptorales bacterium]|nr:division/cell wall cluster transcriptional repressor MraZ [Nitriliruptorales bacterium]